MSWFFFKIGFSYEFSQQRAAIFMLNGLENLVQQLLGYSFSGFQSSKETFQVRNGIDNIEWKINSTQALSIDLYKYGGY